MQKGARFTDFLRAFSARWFVTMSGPAAVPLSIAAFYLTDNALLKGLFALTALAGAFFSSFWIWKIQRDRVLELEERLKPTIEWVFPLGGITEVKLHEPTGRNITYDSYLLHLINRGDKTIENCQVAIGDMFVCGPCDLRPGETTRIPFIRTERNTDFNPVIFMWTRGNARWEERAGFALIAQQGDHKMKIIADNMFPIMLQFELIHKDDRGWCIMHMRPAPDVAR
jgi:hypothetical protein